MNILIKIALTFSFFLSLFHSTFWFYHAEEILPSKYNTTVEIVLIKDNIIYLKETNYNYLNNSYLLFYYKYNPDTFKLTKLLIYNPHTKKIEYIFHKDIK